MLSAQLYRPFTIFRTILKHSDQDSLGITVWRAPELTCLNKNCPKYFNYDWKKPIWSLEKS